MCIGCGRCEADWKDGYRGISFVVSESSLKEKRADSCGQLQSVRLITVDIGTTTIAMQLYDEDGSVADTFAQLNPQIAYGADVLSRIQAAKQEKNAAQKMQWDVKEVLHQGFLQFRKLMREDERMFAVIAANTTMSYLLLGLDTQELGEAPFRASYLTNTWLTVGEVPCMVVRSLSAFVGGDIVSGIVACEMMESENVTLLIDLGTNGEMVLGNREHMIACATAAGPAFEGGANRGVWGADMIRILSALLKEGVMDETGLLEEPYFDTGVRVGDVHVTQEAIRGIQLAKGAIRAGIEILIEEYGQFYSVGESEDGLNSVNTSWEIDRVILAGGFGYYLDVESAVRIGLLPENLRTKTVSGGNTALAGARRLGWNILQNEKERAAIQNGCIPETDSENWNLDNIRVLNLARVPEFEERYLASLEFRQ